jgi:crotonobetainyl-CoA:carnitine CoA-transferase CaiB-like acyl-CoA transferase
MMQDDTQSFAENTPFSGPLAGLRVIDLSINVLGPVATQILGDMGADVIKIEPPEGDQNRENGPTRNPGMSAMFMIMNRNKRSIQLDLKQPECLEALMRLVDTADVFVHSMRTTAADRLGIGDLQLRARNPRLIYAHGVGYRGDGPRKDVPAFDDVIQGESGLASLNADADGVPRYFPTVIVDKFCGYVLASSISMALYHRERTGHGQRVQVPMYETMLQFTMFEHLWEGTFGSTKEGLGYSRMFSPHRRPYPTLDGYICVLAVNDSQWQRLLDVIGRPEILAEPKFCDMRGRMANVDELYGMLGAELRKRSTAEWDRLMREADVPHGPVNTLADLLEDPYLRETNFFRHYEHPSEGPLVMTSIPVSFSDSPGSYRLPPPRRGQHTREILESVGYGATEIAAMTAAASANTGARPAP